MICLGDFNDFDAQILDVNDNVPTSRVLEILKGTRLSIVCVWAYGERVPGGMAKTQ